MRSGGSVGSSSGLGAEIEPRDIKRYASSVAARGVSANTVRLALAPLKTLLATAVEDGLIRSNPAAGLRLTVEAQRPDDEAQAEKVKALTEDELRGLLAAVPEEWRLLVTLLAQAGLRVSEALPLRWGDVDFGRRRLRIRRSLSRGRIGAPKTRHGRRDVPLTEGMTRALWNARKAAGDPGDEAPIFTNRNGGPLERDRVFRVVKAAGKRSGVPWVGLHTLRHSAATILFRRGWNAVQVQRFLGHHSPAFTLATTSTCSRTTCPIPPSWRGQSKVRGPTSATPGISAKTQWAMVSSSKLVKSSTIGAPTISCAPRSLLSRKYVRSPTAPTATTTPTWGVPLEAS